MSLDFDQRDRESVLRDLQSEDDEVRRLAVERAGALELEEAVVQLVASLGDSSWRVRKAAVERLVACPDVPRVARALIEALADGENPGRRNAAVEALVASGSRVVQPLIDATASSDADVRKLVVDALAGIGDDRAHERLVELLGDADPNVRAAAADALGAVGGPRSAAALRGAATSEAEDSLVRLSALRAMAALNVSVRAVELHAVLEDPILRPAALDLLGRGDDEESFCVLLKGLVSDSGSSSDAAIRALLRVVACVDGARLSELAARIRETVASHPHVVSRAVDRLVDADLPTRLVLVQFLGLLGVEAAVVPILLAGADEALGQVCLATLMSLGELAERVIDGAWADLPRDARQDACVLFGRSDGERSAERLLAALEDSDPALRTAAARSIGRRRLTQGLAQLVRRLESAAAEDDFESEDELAALGDGLVALVTPRADGASEPDGSEQVAERAIELLAARLDGAIESVRLAIARVLGCIGRRRDTQLVSFLLKDPSARVRRAAVDALARLEPESVAEPLRLALADESADVRIAAAAAIGGTNGGEVFDDLRRLAEDGEPRVRAAAVRALVTRFAGAADAPVRSRVDRLLTAAVLDDALVALGALEAMREVGGPVARRAVDMLERPEPEVLLESIGCIAAHGDVAATESLLSLVAHPDWSVRAEAIQTLAERGIAKAVPPILRRLETEQDQFVRDVILRALKRLEG